MLPSRLRNRRIFLKQTAGAFLVAPAFMRNLAAAAPSEVVRHASFGAEGMAGADLTAIAKHPKVKLVCVAEVDLARTEKLRMLYPDVRVYQDWREMLDKEYKNLDTANVSTPDHMHAAMAMSAMQLGLHVYVQKPLTHDVYESRRLAQFAREKLVTQMGIQGHSSAQYRSAVAAIQSGAIGKVRAVHSWSSKTWGDMDPRPDREDPVPATLNWDLWLGIAEKRPFIGNRYYHPGNWRKRLDFGTGTFGDMGCHIFDPVASSLELTVPLTIRSTGPAPNAHNWAIGAVVEYKFPQTKYTLGPTVAVTWYDGGKLPPQEVLAPLLGEKKPPEQGSLFLGERGAILLPHVEFPVLLPTNDAASDALPRVDATNHWKQFVDAVRGEGSTSAHFGYAGPLTESVLLGGVATYFPEQTLEWDAAKLQFKNSPAADRLIRRIYRPGWDVAGLS